MSFSRRLSSSRDPAYPPESSDHNASRSRPERSASTVASPSAMIVAETTSWLQALATSPAPSGPSRTGCAAGGEHLCRDGRVVRGAAEHDREGPGDRPVLAAGDRAVHDTYPAVRLVRDTLRERADGGCRGGGADEDEQVAGIGEQSVRAVEHGLERREVRQHHEQDVYSGGELAWRLRPGGSGGQQFRLRAPRVDDEPAVCGEQVVGHGAAHGAEAHDADGDG